MWLTRITLARPILRDHRNNPRTKLIALSPAALLTNEREVRKLRVVQVCLHWPLAAAAGLFDLLAGFLVGHGLAL